MKRKMKTRMFINDESGQTMVEYAILLGIIIVALSVTIIMPKIQDYIAENRPEGGKPPDWEETPLPSPTTPVPPIIIVNEEKITSEIEEDPEGPATDPSTPPNHPEIGDTNGDGVIDKLVRIKNVGTSPAYIRVKMEFSTAKAEEDLLLSANNGSTWLTYKDFIRNPPPAWAYIPYDTDGNGAVDYYCCDHNGTVYKGGTCYNDKMFGYFYYIGGDWMGITYPEGYEFDAKPTGATDELKTQGAASYSDVRTAIILTGLKFTGDEYDETSLYVYQEAAQIYTKDLTGYTGDWYAAWMQYLSEA